MEEGEQNQRLPVTGPSPNLSGLSQSQAEVRGQLTRGEHVTQLQPVVGLGVLVRCVCVQAAGFWD